MLLDAWHLWTILAILLVIGEIFTAGFVLACFALGCLAAGLLGYFNSALTWQLLGFSVATLVAFVLVRPLALEYLGAPGDGVRTNTDALIGRRGTVSERLDPATGQGRVKVEGEDWWGITTAGRVLESGESIVVTAVDGAKLVVEPAPTRLET